METTRKTTAQSVYPALRYNDPKAAIAWLKRAFGLEEHVVYEAEDGSIAHAELKLNGNLIMLGGVKNDGDWKSPRDLHGVTSSLYIAIQTPAAIDALCERAKAAGAEITRDVGDTDYGSHEFGARDVEGHRWSFGTYAPQAD